MIDECEAVGGMGVGRGDQNTLRRLATLTVLPPQIPYDLTWDHTWAATVESQQLLACAVTPTLGDRIFIFTTTRTSNFVDTALLENYHM
jgi:hypothetical protein